MTPAELSEALRAVLVAAVADGAVVGSAIVKRIGEGQQVGEVLEFVRTLTEGAHRA